MTSLKTTMRSLSALLLGAAVLAAPLRAQEYPTEPGDGIADLANVIAPADADSIRAILYALRSDPGVEVRVLTIPSVAEYRTASGSVPAFATGVYNEWRLGYDQRQDGVLVLLSVADREARIELGDNVPAAQDARMQRVMDEVMVPHFRAARMSAGMLDGVRAIARSFRDPAAYTPADSTPGLGLAGSGATAPGTAAPADTEEGGGGGVLAVVAGLLGLGGIGLGGGALLRNRRRKCGNCGQMMNRLDEAADDVHLDSGRRLEEVMGSVNHDVWQCPGCANHQITSRRAFFGGKPECPQCHYRTVEVKKRVLESATYTSSGRQQITKDCKHCQWHDEDIAVLPRLQRSSSSGTRSGFSSGSSSSSRGSSSGGSRSSGGSSSGRGASGKW